MNKKLIAVAVGAAFGAPALAFAQASTVQIYGSVNIEYAYIDEGGTRNSYDRLTNPKGSKLGFKGEEKLGGGLSAWFQCESTLDATGGGGTLCQRNSAVGFKGSFGNLFLGTWYTAYRTALDSTKYRPFFTTSIYGMGSLLFNESTTANNTSNTDSFYRRQKNQIQYWTPTWNGLTGRFSWSAKNEVTGSPDAAPELALAGREPRVISFGADYKRGPFAVGVGYEQHEEFRANAGGGFGDDRGWMIAGGYTFAGVFRLGAAFERLTYETGVAGNPGAETERDAYAITGLWQIQGPHSLRVAFVKADDSEGGGGRVSSIGSSIPGATVTTQTGAVVPAGDNGAEQFSIRYDYAFSKRTSVGFGYTRIDNDDAGLYRIRDGATRATGQDQDAFGIIVLHNF